jgi:hypothetical protein
VDDAQIVAAISAGELTGLAGLAAALDKYAAPLYEYCYSMAPEFAAEAVQDTFVVASCTLGMLDDPDRLYHWLQTVAGNECYRRTLAGSTDVALPPAEAVLPPRLPGQVLSACADNTPAGRAYRVSVTHRAGPFGRDGYPKGIDSPRRWRRVGGHPRAAAVIVFVAALAAAATAMAIQSSGGTHRQEAAAAPPSGQLPSASPTSQASLPTTPARRITASPHATRSHKAKQPKAPASAMAQTGTPAAPVRAAPPPSVVPLVTVTVLPSTWQLLPPPPPPVPPPPLVPPPPTPPPGHGNGNGNGSGTGDGSGGNGKGGR